MTSEVKHTSGPWHVRTLENFGWNIVRYIGGDKFDIGRIAKVNSEADAHLIAAAPAMLEALEEVTADLEAEIEARRGSVLERTTERDLASVRKARAAIRLAKGGV